MANLSGSWFRCQCPVEKRHLAAVFKHDAPIKEFDELDPAQHADGYIHSPANGSATPTYHHQFESNSTASASFNHSPDLWR